MTFLRRPDHAVPIHDPQPIGRHREPIISTALGRTARTIGILTLSTAANTYGSSGVARPRVATLHALLDWRRLPMQADPARCRARALPEGVTIGAGVPITWRSGCPHQQSATYRCADRRGIARRSAPANRSSPVARHMR